MKYIPYNFRVSNPKYVKKKLIFEDFLIDYYKNIFRQSNAKKLREKKLI